MKSVVAAALAAFASFALSACGTLEENWPTAKEIVPFDQGAAGLLVLDDMNRGCTDLYASFQDARTGKPYYRFVRPGIAAAMVVPPGKYRLWMADCIGDSYEEFPNISIWFDDVTVGPGEVVYTGSLQVETIAVQKKSGALTQVLTLGLLGDKETDVFPVYSFKDNSDAAREKLRAVSLPASEKMVTRLPGQVLSKEAVTKAYQNAYAAKPDGTAPTQDEVSARLKVEMRTAFATSIDEYLKREAPSQARPAPPAPKPAQ